MKFLLERLKEPSTYRGLTVMLGLAGYQLSPEQSNAIMAAVIGIIALIEVFRVEDKQK